MIEAGQTVGGYRVERLIGRGGMGVVYEAVQISVKRRVALKVLRQELAEDPAFVERFRREARAQAAIEHPHVLEVYEVGEGEEGLFLAMRLVSGETLLDLLLAEELAADRSLKLLDQVTGALDAAHEVSLVHRDIKPQNVLIGDGDHAFLADFGLTREGSDTTIASSRPMMGSVAYVAPEIVRGEEPTPAADRYSIAATLFHCLTGDVVFPRSSDAAVLYAHAAEAPPSVRDRRVELPGELDQVFDAALAKQPDARPASARSIVEAARDAMGPDTSRFASPPVVDWPLGSLTTPPPPAPARRKSGSSRLAFAGVLLAGVAIGIGAALLVDADTDNARAAATVAPVPDGAQPLGSLLTDPPDRSVDCRGEVPSPRSPPCAIVQTELSNGTVLAPSDGVIVGWAVEGAEGELALDVIRPRGADTVRIGRSQWEVAGNAGPHYFETELAVEAGDQIGLELGSGAAIGVSDADGASTQRWREPLGGAYGTPDLGEGTGFDHEVAVRADFVPGERIELPEHLKGAAAANAPKGNVRVRSPLVVESHNTKLKLELQLVELGGRVALDVNRDGVRTLRVFIEGLEPEGVPVEMKAGGFPGEAIGEVGVWWTNPNSGRATFTYLIVGDGLLEGAG